MTQGLNPGLLFCRKIVNHLSHYGNPRILEWVAILRMVYMGKLWFSLLLTSYIGMAFLL